MSEAIAAEVQAICRRAAEPIRPGESIKTQLNRAWENLGRPPFWRLRAGWYAESGAWSAAAVKDFQARYLAMVARDRRRAELTKAIEDAKSSIPTTITEAARDEYRILSQRIAAIEEALRLSDPNGDRA